MSTTFCVFDRAGYVVRAAVPIDEASRLATLVGGTVAPMHVTPPRERLRVALDVLSRTLPDLPPAAQWFLDDARAALDEWERALRQGAA